MTKKEYEKIISAIEYNCNNYRHGTAERIIELFAVYGLKVYGKYNHDSEKSIHNYQSHVVTTYLDNGIITVWSKYSSDESCEHMDYILNVYERNSLIAQFAIYGCEVETN